MAFLTKDRIFSKKWIKDYFFIALGSFILASSFVFFITPHKIVPGGVYGISIVVHYLTAGMFSFWPDGVPIGLFALLLDIPLIIAGVKVLGPRFGVKTITSTILSAVFIDVISYFREVPSLPLVNDVLLSSVFGGVLLGFGLGLIFKSRATSGGTDIVAMILAKYTHIPIGRLIMYVDSSIVLLGLLAFGDWAIPLYSWTVIFITVKVIDITLEGADYNKALLIISKEHQLIRKKLIEDLDRGGTYLMGEGMYTGEQKQIIYTVVSRREVEVLKEYISNIDPAAFITVMEAKEILGEGFQKLKDNDSD